MFSVSRLRRSVLWLALVAGFLATRASAQDPKTATLLQELAKGDPKEAWSTAAKLAKLGDDAIPDLVKELNSTNDNVRFGAARALLAIDPGKEEEAAGSLLALIGKKSADETLKQCAIDALVDEEMTGVGELLWKLGPDILDGHTKIKLYWAAWILDQEQRQAAKKELKAILKSDNPEFKYESALALADIEDYESVTPILEELALQQTDRGRRARLYLKMSQLTKYVELLSRAPTTHEASRPGAGEDNIMDEAIRVITDIHNEVAVQGWKKKELRSFLEENAVRGMLRALDPHSSLMTSEELELWTYDLNPTYSGIGSYVEMDEQDSRLILTQPMFGGPAYRAGLETGDKVIKIDGWEAHGKRTSPVD